MTHRVFWDLKHALTSPPVLATYDQSRDCNVSADSSSYGLGGVQLQRWDEEWKPVAYASRSLTATEQRYAQVKKEALGLTWACGRFRSFLIGKHFQMETNHKLLLSLLWTFCKSVWLLSHHEQPEISLKQWRSRTGS